MRKKGRRLSLAVLFFIVLFGGCASGGIIAGGKESPDMRVLILKGKTDLLIKGSSASSEMRFEYGGDGRVTLNAKETTLPLRYTPEDEFIYVEERPYRGIIEVREDEREGSIGLMVINEVPLEPYIAGIINSEISSMWPAEAVKAQAVIARTYAVHQRDARANPLFDLTSTLMDQVYTGAGGEDEASLHAVKETEGEVLTYDGMPALTVYHSNGGGVTEDCKEVWGADYPYLRGVKSAYDRTSAGYLWELSLSSSSLGGIFKKAGYEVDRIEALKVTERTKTGRVKKLVIKGSGGNALTLTGVEFRKALGYSALRSTLFEVEKRGDEFVFSGRGSGHGVGLSQWGAKGMAEDGYGYKEILRHYYPGTELRRVY
ncbi:MAG: SpoIID/LytB domain-containing protein [Deltaproteobacteria bacterium]|nr:SpoIID/LytB domain-containing protein [Deltaproteobacteria bacterium]